MNLIGDGFIHTVLWHILRYVTPLWSDIFQFVPKKFMINYIFRKKSWKANLYYSVGDAYLNYRRNLKTLLFILHNHQHHCVQNLQTPLSTPIRVHMHREKWTLQLKTQCLLKNNIFSDTSCKENDYETKHSMLKLLIFASKILHFIK